MKKVKIKTPAKINLTLDIVGEKEGYHMLHSMVASISVYSNVTLRAHKNSKITAKFHGHYKQDGKNTLARRAATAFCNKYKVPGVGISVKTEIPFGGGLGGSSADVAGVLNGMKELYGIDGDLTEIANSLGSDTAYMLKGGYAVLSGRGERIEFLEKNKKLYLLLILNKRGVSTPACYKEYDRIGERYEYTTELALKNFNYDFDKEFLDSLSNHLYPAAVNLNPKIEKNYLALKRFGAAVMTGSGATVCGVYLNKKERDNAYKNLRGEYGKQLIKAETV